MGFSFIVSNASTASDSVSKSLKFFLCLCSSCVSSRFSTIDINVTGADGSLEAIQALPTSKPLNSAHSAATLFDETPDRPEPNSTPPSRIGLRQTKSFYLLDHTVNDGHTLFAFNDLEVDKVPPSEDEQIVQATLQDDNGVPGDQGKFLALPSDPVVADCPLVAHTFTTAEIMEPSSSLSRGKSFITH